MPRKPRIVLPGYFHHVTQRGSRRQQVFFEDPDREYYLELLDKYSKKHDVQVLCYCLMSNHVHLGLVPATSTGLSEVLKPLHMRYAQRINSKMGWAGHLWQARFYSSPVEDQSIERVVRYILLNPVRAGMVAQAEDYPWSNASRLSSGKTNQLTACTIRWQKILKDVSRNIAWDNSTEEDDVAGIREATKRDLPIGSSFFIESLESKLKLNLRIRALGRPAGESSRENRNRPN